VLGRDPLNRREACQIRKSCGIVPQNKALYGNYTVAEMCRLCKAFYPNWQTHLETRLLDRFELVPRHRVSQLSHTQRALLSATLALAHLPPLLLLDEPFDELDPHAAQSLLQALIEAAGEASATVVIATNNPERVEAVADHALFFSSGKVVLSSSTDEIARSWRLITAHFPAETVLSSLPVSSVEYMRGDGSRAEWVVSDHAAESASIVQSLGALSVRVESLTLYTLFSRFLN
jgi:ABC-2 type transport system ATP-binding protein